MGNINRAFLSVANKENLLDLAQPLADKDVELIATGGTKKHLEEAGLKVTSVDEITGYSELLAGRVKSLHPVIFAGILARDREVDEQELEKEGIEKIDLVVCNLYPFADVIKHNPDDHNLAVENIDIGGSALIRAAAKNHERIAVLTAPSQYSDFIENYNKGNLNLKYRKKLAAKAFALTTEYDGEIAGYLNNNALEKENNQPESDFPERIIIEGNCQKTLKYGENPHQKASAYLAADSSITGNDGQSILQGELVAGDKLSYNNINDAAAALELAREFPAKAAVALIKHTNPCGLAVSDSPVVAFRRAHAGDPESAYGSIAAINEPVDATLSREITGGRKYIEVIIAPSFSDEAKNNLIDRWKDIRLLAVGRFEEINNRRLEVKSIAGGFLLQETDDEKTSETELEVVTKEEPSEDVIKDLSFAWKAVKHVKSNAIVLARDNALVGVGAGQMSRIDAVRLAGRKASGRQRGGVLASDAFFPFPDAVEDAERLGIKAIIQPGGSIRDEAVIKACDRAGIKMVFTGKRHFKH